MGFLSVLKHGNGSIVFMNGSIDARKDDIYI